MRHDQHNAGRRLGGGNLKLRDPTARDRRVNTSGIEQPLHRYFGGETRGAPHLVGTIDSRLLRAEGHAPVDQRVGRAARQPTGGDVAHCGADTADDGVLQLAHASAPFSSPSTATMILFASSVLKPLPSKGLAAESSASAASRKRSLFGTWPRRTSSARAARHGFAATPPRAIDRKSTRLNSSHPSISYA